MLVAGCLTLDSKKGKASLFNPVSSDNYPVSARVHKQRTPKKLDPFVKPSPYGDD
jgi:hypothetical protein